jgi:uncharacterized metal-binding protein YceD (DUF177 family)
VTQPELHRPSRVSRIAPDGVRVVVESSDAERAALAARMGLPAIHALGGRFDLVREANGTVAATGRLTATVVQTCVVSLEDFESAIAEDFTVRFVPEGTESDDPDPESVDEIPYAGDTIDLGEATAEQMALSLDPYPRRPDASLPDEAEAAVDSRLAGLAAWRGGRGPGGSGLQ